MAAYPFSDGTPLASQWPIPPQHFFDYELQMPNRSAGTYFYHSHVGFQAVSCSGPLIVEDKVPPYDVDGERVVHIQELFNETDTTIEQGLQATPFVWSGETNGFIINGKTISNFGVTDHSSCQLAVIDIEPDRMYRIRFIGAHSLSYSALGVEDHTDLQIIEADGQYTKPYSTTFLQIGSGQRFSALLKSKTCNELKQFGKLDYYVQIESRERPSNITNYAILRYNKSCMVLANSSTSASNTTYPSRKPIALPPTVPGFLDYVLQPLYPNDFPSASQVTRRIVLNVQQVLDKYIVWKDSNVSWTADAIDSVPHTTASQPYLVSLYMNQTAYLPSYSAAVKNGGRDPSTNTFPAKVGEVLEIVFQNVGAHAIDNETGGGLDVHPWHAHGEHYYDIGGGPGAFDPNVAEARLKDTEPVLRDTTMLYRYNATTQPDEKQGWRAWRLRVQEPGVWMIHCHTLQHMVMGMQTVWVFGDAEQVMALPKAEVEGYLTYGGDAYGNSSHAPDVIHFSELDGGI